MATWTRAHRWADRYRMHAYYVGMAAVGAMAVVGDPAPSLVGALGSRTSAAWFGVWYVVVACLAMLARARRQRSTEAAAVTSLGVFTAAHGVLLCLDGAWSSGIRLAIAILMMSDWAHMRRGVMFTREQWETVSSASRD